MHGSKRELRLLREIDELSRALESVGRDAEENAQALVARRNALDSLCRELDSELLAVDRLVGERDEQVWELNRHGRAVERELAIRDREIAVLKAALEVEANRGAASTIRAQIDGFRSSASLSKKQRSAELAELGAALSRKKQDLASAKTRLQEIKATPQPAEVDLPPRPEPRPVQVPRLAPKEAFEGGSTSTDPGHVEQELPLPAVMVVTHDEAMSAPVLWVRQKDESPADDRWEWLIDCVPGAELVEGAETILAAGVRSASAGVDVLYGDEVSVEGLRWCKPQPDRDLMLARDCLGPAVAVRRSVAEQFGMIEAEDSGLWRTRLVLELQTSQFFRIAEVLGQWQGDDGRHSSRDARAAQLRVAGIESCPGRFKSDLRILWPIPNPAPKVSIIIPTKDRADLLRTCLGGVRNETDYLGQVEVVVVDNGSTETDALALLDILAKSDETQVIREPGPFNFAALCNAGGKAASGEILCLLNNDIEVLEPGWLTELVRQAVRPEIGLVGAKLLYPDRTVQHAGMVLGLGVGGAAEHVLVGIGEDEPGYAGYAQVARACTVMTAACLAVRAATWKQLDGMDEMNTPVTCNDLDVCLRAIDSGLTNLWTPHALLMHHESASREDQREGSRSERLLARIEAEHILEGWPDLVADDPCYSPALSRDLPGFE